MRAGDHAAGLQLIEMCAPGVAAKRIGEVFQYFVWRLAAEILVRHLQFENFAERRARLDGVARQPEDLEEAAVDDLEPLLRVEQAKPLRHIVERRVEAPIGLPQARFLLFRQGDVAAHDDEALVARDAMADAQPAPVRQQHFAGRLRITLAPGQDAAGGHRIFEGRAQIAKRRARLQQRPRDTEEVGRLRIGQCDAVVRIHHHDAFLRAFQRVGQARLCGALLRDFALHHGLDVVAHRSHGCEQRAQFVGATFRDDDVELAGSDALGDPRCSGDRPHDAPRQSPGDDRRQEQRQRCADDVQI